MCVCVCVCVCVFSDHSKQWFPFCRNAISTLINFNTFSIFSNNYLIYMQVLFSTEFYEILNVISAEGDKVYLVETFQAVI